MDEVKYQHHKKQCGKEAKKTNTHTQTLCIEKEESISHWNVCVDMLYNTLA